MPPSALGFDLKADTATVRLLFLRAEGLTAHRLDREGWATLPTWGAHCAPILAVADGRRLPAMPLTLSDLYLVPGQRALDMVQIQGDSAWLWSRLLSPPRARMEGPNDVALTLPRWQAGRFNGDDTPDLFVVTEGTVDCYLNADRCAPDGRPPHFRYHPGGQVLQPSALADWGRSQTDIEIRDLDGDGLDDLIAVRSPRARILTEPCQIQIYWNRNGRWPQVPDQVMTADHFGGHVALADFNADGRTDLWVTRFSTGLGQLIRYLLTRRVQLGCDIHYQLEDGRFGPKPDIRMSYNRVLDPARLPIEADASVAVADLDGDGWPDLAAPTGPHQWTLFYNDPGKPLGKRRQSIQGPGDGSCQVWNLDGDGADDLIFWGAGRSGRSEVILVHGRGKAP